VEFERMQSTLLYSLMPSSSVQQQLFGENCRVRQFYRKLKVGFEVITGTQSVASKRSHALSAVAFHWVDT
jgi:hypothetical protein